MPISPFEGSDAPSRSDGSTPTCDRAVLGPSDRHRGRLLRFASAVGRYATRRQRQVDSPLRSESERPAAEAPADESALENARLGQLRRASSAGPGGEGSGAGLEHWESGEVVTLMVFLVGTFLISMGHLVRNPSSWPELVGMGAIVIAQYAQLFRPPSERSVRFRNAGIIVLLIAVLRMSTRDSLVVFCIRLALLLASAQAVFLCSRRAHRAPRTRQDGHAPVPPGGPSGNPAVG
jgi:hypothetical protein